MPRQRSVQAVAATPSRPTATREVEQRLFGLGPFKLQLDNCRMTAPAPLRQRLAAQCDREFVFSLWHGPRLRIVPEALWIPYLDLVRAQINNPAQAEHLVLSLEQTCAAGALDFHHRWFLPTTLAHHAGLRSGQNYVVLLPCRFWLEVLSAKAWEVLMAQTLECARLASIRPTDFEI